jgi:hypothetical protein
MSSADATSASERSNSAKLLAAVDQVMRADPRHSPRARQLRHPQAPPVEAWLARYPQKVPLAELTADVSERQEERDALVGPGKEA